MKIDNLTKSEIMTICCEIERTLYDIQVKQNLNIDAFTLNTLRCTEMYYRELLEKIKKSLEQEEAVMDAIDEMRGVKYQ